MNGELTAGKITELADGVRRIIAPNPGMMTGPGTNTYLIGTDAIAVIDPGPVIESHLQMIADSGNIKWILVSHTHPDHSPGAGKLAELTGAITIGIPAPDGEHQDKSFRPDRIPADGDTLDGPDFSIQMISTPGHASNHLCFLHAAHRWLFTGDHIMNGSTVVINPPDGDMREYLRSLANLRKIEIDAIAPGHGDVFYDPRDVIDWIVEHRLSRERKVADAVSAYPDLTSHELVPHVYADVDKRLHGWAERSLLAHLIKLKKDQRVIEQESRWSMTEA
jgi:glyoxylase-like metal-dependent hydrolase (beta-lactamase superfamily II)